jgi:hypothetical protein
VSVALVPAGSSAGVWGGAASEPKNDGYQAVAGLGNIYFFLCNMLVINCMCTLICIYE